ncbi:MAG: hypothetical protein K0S01_1810 [Herbinix sp.]|jgi:hypothetical protein|nr:hypothetical protein [Herbinix sp.]
MSVNGITSATQTYENKSTSKAKSNQNQQVDDKKQKDADSTAVVYDKSEQTVEKKKTYQKDATNIDRLMAEADKRTQSLRDLVQKMLLKQGQTITDATDIYGLLREGKLEVDPETSAQAQKDIAADGYWGVDQTSERMVSFAKALTGGDPSKADEMIDAVKKGFEEATKAWGGELPGISKSTMDATISKLEAWRDGTDNASSMSNAAAKTFKNQAVTGTMA